jgi:hypothetical protein
VIAGGFAGYLLPIPNTNAQLGVRVGGEGGNISGNIVTPAASPLFTYKVQTNWIAYQEALVQINMREGLVVEPTIAGFFNGIKPFGSLGVAESGVSVKGTSGTFSVTDSAVRTGITFTAGVGLPVAVFPSGTGIDLFAQYRGTQWISTVNIPGAVNIGSFTNEVDVGVTVSLSGEYHDSWKAGPLWQTR